jgi:hypothetical protein
MTRALAVSPSLRWLNAAWLILRKSAAFFILWAILYTPFVVLLAPRIENLLNHRRHFCDSISTSQVLASSWQIFAVQALTCSRAVHLGLKAGW